MVAILILVVVGLLVLASIVRLIWRASRGDMQIEPSSEALQLFGRDKRDSVS